METNQFIQELRNSDLESWMLVQKDYQKYAQGEDIMECGFNKQSGYVYIALENGISIASCFGQSVDYIVYDFETGEEFYLDSYEEALNTL
jgi:hypothetical protein